MEDINNASDVRENCKTKFHNLGARMKIVHISIFACILSIALPTSARSQAAPGNYTPSLPTADYPYPGAGVKIGQGWDSFNQSGTAASCVNVVEVPLERASFETHVDQIQSTYSLVTQTTTSVSASFSGGGFGASGSLSASSSHSINTDDQNFLFTFNSSNGSTFAVAPSAQDNASLELSDQAVKALAAIKGSADQQNYLQRFLARPPTISGAEITLTTDAEQLRKTSRRDFGRLCGDGFVSAIHRGGRINLLLTQKFASQADSSSLQASLGASGYGASGSASYSTSTQQLATTANLAYRVFQQGGLPFKPAALGSVGANNFFDVNTILPPPDQLIANPTAFTVTVTPYENKGYWKTRDSVSPSPSEFGRLLHRTA